MSHSVPAPVVMQQLCLAVVSRAWCVVVGMALTIGAENDGELLATLNDGELLSTYASWCGRCHGSRGAPSGLQEKREWGASNMWMHKQDPVAPLEVLDLPLVSLLDLELRGCGQSTLGCPFFLWCVPRRCAATVVVIASVPDSEVRLLLARDYLARTRTS